jgi:hypothetical protein
MSLRPSVFARMLNVPGNKRSAGKDGCLAKYAASASAAAVAARSALTDARRFPAGRCCFKGAHLRQLQGQEAFGLRQVVQAVGGHALRRRLQGGRAAQAAQVQGDVSGRPAGR